MLQMDLQPVCLLSDDLVELMGLVLGNTALTVSCRVMLYCHISVNNRLASCHCWV
jgi:hypothetical protein